MFSITLLLMLCVSLSGLLRVDTGLISSQEAELRRYRYRVAILHKELLDLNCSDVPSILVRRQLLTDSHHTEHQLSVEKSLYYHLLDLIVTCKKSLLATTEKPPQKSSTVKSTILPTTTTTTELPTTATPLATTTTTTTTTPMTSTTTASTRSTTTLKPTTTKSVACLSGYVKNPYANTCIRLVEEKVTWSVAKAACESSGEYLAVFDTEEAARWIVKFMKDKNNPNGWRNSFLWYGAKYSIDGYRWQGRITSHLPNSSPVWDQDSGEPNGGRNDCGCVSGAYNRYHRLHDCECNNKLYYICEKN